MKKTQSMWQRLTRILTSPFRRSTSPPRERGAFVAGRTTTGVNVTESTALHYSAVWCAVRVIAENFGSLPCQVFEGGMENQKLVDHPLNELLLYSPNREQTAMQFRECLQAHTVAWGNGYAEIQRTKGGDVAALWPIPPNLIRPVRTERDELRYEVTAEKKGQKNPILKPDQVLHIAGLGWDGIKGYGVIKHAAESIGLGMAAEHYGAAYFGSGARPAGVLSHPGQLKDDDARNAILDTWQEAYGGLKNSHRVALLEEGLKFELIGQSPEQAQLLSTRTYQISDVARWFNIPPHLLKDLSKASFASLEQQSLEFVIYCLRPWCVRWEQAKRMKLLSESERKRGLYLEHNVDALLRGDMTSRYTAHASALSAGWKTINNVRAAENLPPVEGGDELRAPMNQAPVAGGGAGAAKEGDAPLKPNPKAQNPELFPQRSTIRKLKQDLRKLKQDLQRFVRCGGPGSGIPGPCPEATKSMSKKEFSAWLKGKQAEKSQGGGYFKIPTTPGAASEETQKEFEEWQKSQPPANPFMTPKEDKAHKTKQWKKFLKEKGIGGLAKTKTKRSLREWVAIYAIARRCGGPGSGIPGPCPGWKKDGGGSGKNPKAFKPAASAFEPKPEGYWGSKEQPLRRPGPNPTVDAVITRDNAETGEKEVLLIQRAVAKKEDVARLGEAGSAALNEKYGYGKSEPGSFGAAANKSSTEAFLASYHQGERDVERLASAVHEGWAQTARSFDDPKANADKKASREKLAATPYESLPEEEKEKDRVMVRAMLAEAARKEPEKIAEGGKWALPGGFHDSDMPFGKPWKPGRETAKEAAVREVAEETGLNVKALTAHLQTVGHYETGPNSPNKRDPRDNAEAWSKSLAFKVHLPPKLAKKMVSGQDDAKDAKWVPVSQLASMALAFDHGTIIGDAKLKPQASKFEASAKKSAKKKRSRRAARDRRCGGPGSGIPGPCPGGGEGGEGGAKPAMKGSTKINEAAKASLEKLFPGRTSPEEVRSLVGVKDPRYTVILEGSESGALRVTAFLKDPSTGEDVAMLRSFHQEGSGETVCRNLSFDASTGGKTGTGIGREIFANQVAELRRAGVARIETFAAAGTDLAQTKAYNGAVTWPKMGYDGPLDLVTRVKMGISGLWTRTVQDLMAKPWGEKWWAENSTSMNMTFDLKPGSKSVALLDKYLAKKGAAPLSKRDADEIELRSGNFEAADMPKLDQVERPPAWDDDDERIWQEIRAEAAAEWKPPATTPEEEAEWLDTLEAAGTLDNDPAAEIGVGEDVRLADKKTEMRAHPSFRCGGPGSGVPGPCPKAIKSMSKEEFATWLKGRKEELAKKKEGDKGKGKGKKPNPEPKTEPPPKPKPKEPEPPKNPKVFPEVPKINARPASQIDPDLPIADRLKAYASGRGGEITKSLTEYAEKAKSAVEAAQQAEDAYQAFKKAVPADLISKLGLVKDELLEPKKRQEYRRLLHKVVQARDDVARANEKIHDAIAATIPEKQVFDTTDDFATEPLKFWRERLETSTAKGMAFVSKLTARARAPVEVQFEANRSGRAFYRNDDRVISTTGDASTVAHEMGHWLDDEPGIGEVSKAFLAHRVGNEKPSLIYPTGKPEYGRADEFERAFGRSAKYVGKVYASGATEVLSMGLEKLYRDPIKLITQDPEYFQFVVGVLDGSLRGKRK